MTRIKLAIFFLMLTMFACAIEGELSRAVPATSVAYTATSSPTRVLRATGNVWIRSLPGGVVVGYKTAGESFPGVCSGSWCEIDGGAGWVWRGCTDDNPEGLGCKAK